MPQLSIIVPIYNCGKYLSSSLDAILAQTFTDFELILVDDGSIDNSSEICKKYADKDHRIFVINKQNEGAGSARNTGIAIANGEYIAFPDGDDYIVPNMYGELMEQARKYDADIVYSGLKNICYNENDMIISSNNINYPFMFFSTRKECREHIMYLKPTSTLFDVPWNKIYKLSVITKNNLQFPSFRRVQDAVFNLEFYNFVSSVVTIPNIHYHYRNNNQSNVWMKFPKDYIDIVIYYNKRLVELMVQWEVLKNETKIFCDSAFIAGVWETCVFCLNPNWKMGKKQKYEYIQNILNMEYVKRRAIQANVRQELYKYMILIRKGSANCILNEIYNNRFENSIKNTLKKIPFLFKLAKNVKSIVK